MLVEPLHNLSTISNFLKPLRIDCGRYRHADCKARLEVAPQKWLYRLSNALATQGCGGTSHGGVVIMVMIVVFRCSCLRETSHRSFI